MVWNRNAVQQWENISANLFAAYTIQMVDAVKNFGQTDYTAGWLYALDKAHGRATTNLILAKAGLRRSFDPQTINDFIARIVASGNRKGNEDFLRGMRDGLTRAIA